MLATLRTVKSLNQPGPVKFAGQSSSMFSSTKTGCARSFHFWRDAVFLVLSVLTVVIAFGSSSTAKAQEIGLSDSDIGSVGASGGTTYYESTGIYSSAGAGAGIGTAEDSCNFSHVVLHENGEVSLHFAGIQNVASQGRAGLMIRGDLSAGAKMAALLFGQSGDLNFVRRLTASSLADTYSVPSTNFAWIKLVRRGNSVLAFQAVDGVNWLLVGTDEISLNSDVFVGIAVTSESSSVLATASVDHLEVGKVDLAAISGGRFHSLALKSDGSVWWWGSDDPYQGPDNIHGIPVQVTQLTNAIDITAGEYHSLALESDGTVWAWGNNWTQQLGPRNESDFEIPDQVQGLDHVVSVAAASGLSVAVKDDGTVWTWGWNSSGQLGYDTGGADNGTPTQVIGISNVVAIAAGQSHVVALKSDGTVWGWGESVNGQVGDGTENADVPSPVQVYGLTGVIAIGAGSYHSLAVKADGTVWTWGANWSGQLGDGTYDQHATPVQVTGLSDITAVAGGEAHSLALESDGSVWSWGENGSGQLGDGTNNQSISPEQVPVVADVNRIGAGAHHSLAGRLSDGKVWAWGDGQRFQLGNGSNLDRQGPSQVASFRLDDQTPSVVEPTISPAEGGQFNEPTPITINCETEGAVIYYTLDGSDPTTSSFLYSQPLNLTGRFTLKAKAFLPDGSESELESISFAILVQTPGINPVAGGTFTSPLTISLTTGTPGASIFYSLDGSALDSGSALLYSGSFTLAASVQIQAQAFKVGIAPSDVTFADFSFYQTLDSPLVSPPGETFEDFVTVTLSTVAPGSDIRFTLDGSDPGVGATLYTTALSLSQSADLKARTFSPGMNASPIVEALFANALTVATPIFEPVAGNLPVAQSVIIRCATPEADIHYTLDGSEPTLDSPAIASDASVFVDGFTPLVARAWKAGLTASGLGQADYWITGAIAAGQAHTAALRSDGTVWAWGDNNFGELGNGTNDSSQIPVQVNGLDHVVAIAASSYHTLALKNNGTVWGWGDNLSDVLGLDGYTGQSNVPVQIPNLTQVVGIAAGELHCLAVKVDGTVWAWGNNNYAQLGLGYYSPPQRYPLIVPGLGDVRSVAAGEFFSLAVRLEGEIWTWGCNNNGQLGDGTYDWHALPVLVNGVYTAIAAAGGFNHAVGLLSDGNVISWGNNDFGQLGDGSGQTHLSPVPVANLGAIIKLSAAANYSLALSSTGALFAWGENTHGQLGNGTNASAAMPLKIQSPGFANSIVVAAGYNHAISAIQGGQTWTWGDNAYGQLGIVGAGTYPSPVPDFLITDSNGILMPPTITPRGGTFFGPVTVSLGNNAAGAQIRYTLDGSEPSDGSSLYEFPLIVSLGETVLKARIFAEGMTQSALVTANFVVLPAQVETPVVGPSSAGIYATAQSVGVSCATPGADIHYTLDGSNPTQASSSIRSGGSIQILSSKTLKVAAWKDGFVPSEKTASAYWIVGSAAGGESHSLALSFDGRVWAWGQSLRGQSGTGFESFTSYQPVKLPTIVDVQAITAGRNFSLALLKNGTVWSWGDNDYGDLGIGGGGFRASPVPVIGLTDVACIAAGEAHSLALRKDGTVWSWGRNYEGQLGNNGTDFQVDPFPIPGLFNVVAIAAGQYHSVALCADGTVWSWGSNENGQLGDGTTEPRFTPCIVDHIERVIGIAAGGAHTLAIAADHTVLAWGLNTSGEIGNASSGDQEASPVTVDKLDDVVSVAAGYAFSLAVKADGTVFAWGNNGHHQLADGTTADRVVPKPVPGITDALVVSAGWYDAFAMTKANGIISWGDNTFSQLGHTGSDALPISGADFTPISLGTTATPTFAPADGSTILSGEGVTVSSLTPGATIYYTTNGGDPTTDDLHLASGGKISISKRTTIVARAFAAGRETSPPATSTFEAPPDPASIKVATVHIAPEGGFYRADQPVEITCETQGAEIHYTTDGSPPTLSSPVVADGTITVNPPVVLVCGAWRDGLSPSDLRCVQFFPTAPSVSSKNLFASGETHSLALLPDGTVYAWGGNRFGQIGIGVAGGNYPVPVKVPGLSNVIAVAASGNHSMALKVDGSVWGWGDNQLYEVASGLAGNSLSPVQNTAIGSVIAIAAGYEFSLALKNDGTVWGWGARYGGQLGPKTLANRGPQAIPVQLGSISGVIQIAAGGARSLMLTGDGVVSQCGTDLVSGLGSDYVVDGRTITPVSGLAGVTMIGTSLNACIALETDGSAWTWANSSPVKVISSPNAVVTVAAGYNHFLAVKSDGNLFAWQSNQLGQLGIPSSISVPSPVEVAAFGANVIAAVGGPADSIVLRADGTAFAAGDNYYGQLGTGTMSVYGTSNPDPKLVQLAYLDSNGDGITDSAAVALGLNPVALDSNGDGLYDSISISAGVDPTAVGLSFTGIPSPTSPPSGPGPDSDDHTAPTITLLEPVDAVLVQ